MVSIIRDLLRGIIAALPPREAFETMGVSARRGSGAGIGGVVAWSGDALGVEELIKTSD